MKKLSALFLVALLTACSGAKTEPESSDLSETTPEATAEAADPFASAEGSESLATPVTEAEDLPLPEGMEPPASSSVGDASVAANTESPEVPAAPEIPEPESLSAAEEPPVDLSASSTLPDPGPTETAPPPIESSPSDSVPPVAETAPAAPMVTPNTPSERNVRQEYKEYEDRMQNRSKAEEELTDRTLFAHEGGAFQLGLDYAHDAFPDYDFDPGTEIKRGSTMGGMLSFTYFPLRSLGMGRLGFGPQVASYWTEYSFNDPVQGPRTSSKGSIFTLGGKAIYEFQYFLGQLVVPFAFYAYEQVRFKGFTEAAASINYPALRFASQSYGGGLSLNLNRLEPTAASKALASSGVKKFYLSYTFQNRTGSVSTGAGHYLGLRFEY